MSTKRARLPVLVGIDGSDSALDAVAWASREAASRCVDLHILFASAWMSPPGRDGTLELRRRASALLDTAVDTAQAVLPAGRIRRGLRSGSPERALLLVARASALLVLGHPHESFLRDLVAPTFVSTLSEESPVPVVLIGNDDPASQAESGDLPVTVGLSESPASRSAALFAAEEAAATGSPLQLIHVGHESGGHSSQIDTFVERLVAAHPTVAMTFDRPVKSVRSCLAEASGHSRLIVVGSHGSVSARRHRLGLVVDHLAHHARCPVAVVGDACTESIGWPAESEAASL